MRDHNYIKKSLSEFRKSFPDFTETKKSYGKKYISVFFDFSLLDTIPEIPEDVKQLLKTDNKALNDITRIDTLSFCNSYISKYNNMKYYIDFDGITYDIIDDTRDRLLYSVIKIRSLRYSAYKTDIYGYYNRLPIESNNYNWNENIRTSICTLYYRGTKNGNNEILMN